MKTFRIILLAAGLGLLLFAAAPLRAADATYNNLTITGTGDFQGASTVFGSWSEGGGVGGLTLNYTDGTTPAINFIGSGTLNVWQWWQYNGSTNLLSMKLDENNQLIIYTSGTGGTAGITLNPAGMSTFAGSVTMGGTDNELPNQALVSGSSILTEGLGDGRYLALTASSSFVSSANFVVGSGTASGYRSGAIGSGAVASGSVSLAQGFDTTASGNYAVAFGNQTTAQGYDQFVAGQYNVVQGSGTSWVGSDNLFVIGNGTSSGSTSNALVVMKNGDMTVSGALVVSGTSGNPNMIANGGLGVTGTSVGVVVGSGTVTTIVSTGTTNLLLVPQQGDLSMGVFVAGKQPPH